MYFFEMEEGSAWVVDLYPSDFSSNITDVYNRLMEVSSGRLGEEPVAERTDVAIMEFDVPAIDDETVQTGTIFGESITTTNFTMQATTFFEAKMDGDYTFTLDASDGAQGIFFTDSSPFCCGNANNASAIDVLHASRKDIWSIPTDPNHNNNTITITMKEGVRYNMYIFYVNLSGDAKFKFTVTTPEGETTDDFSDFAGHATDIDCDNVHTTSRDYSSWSLDSTSTYSSTVVTIDMTTTTTLETVYYVLTPMTSSSSIAGSSTSEIPLTSEVSSEVLATSDVSSESSVLSALLSETSETTDASSDTSMVSDVSSEIPQTSEVSSEIALTSDVSSEFPLSSDLPGLTSSNVPLTSIATSTSSPVDTSSTSQTELFVS